MENCKDKSKNAKGVIFDIDGVFLDSMAIWKDLGARYISSFGKEPEEGLQEKLFSMSMEQGAEYLRVTYELSQTQDEVMDGLRGMLRDFYFYEVKAKPGAAELLEKFKADGLKITAATSSPREHIERALERNGLLAYIERMFTSAETGTSKHTSDIYDLAAESMGTKPEETYVFEDSLYALKTAADAGYRAVGVYDADGWSDQDEMKKTAEIYLERLDDFK